MLTGSYGDEKMLNILVRQAAYTALIAGAITTTSGMPAHAADSILEDELNLRELPYGLRDWPANKMLVIKSPLIDAPLGYAYISRTGYKEETLGSLAGELLLSPLKLVGSFFGIGGSKTNLEERGRIISNLWVSKQGNCGFHTVLQKRFYGDGDDSSASSYLNVKRIDIGAGNEVVSLEANGEPSLFRRSDFTYEKCSSGQYSNCPRYTGQQYVLRRDWELSDRIIRTLSGIPSKPFKVRYVFSSHTQIAEVLDGGAIAKIFSSCS